MDYKIIDFHTHPFMTDNTNICKHSGYAAMSAENNKRDLQSRNAHRRRCA